MSPRVRLYFLLASLAYAARSSEAIVNRNQQSANLVIYQETLPELETDAWSSGVRCLDAFDEIYFQSVERLTRSYNMVISSVFNMSSPAAQIQDGFLKVMNEAVSSRNRSTDEVYQLRVISDAHKYKRYPPSGHQLLLADYYVIVVDSVWRLQNLMKNYISHMISWNPGARFLVLYNNVNKRNSEKEICQAIFSEFLENFYVHNVAILYATSDTDYSFVLMEYYNPYNCRSLRTHRLGQCRDGTPYPNRQVILFAMSNFFRSFSLKNCTFYMCTSISAPWVEQDCTNGIELSMITSISNLLGFNVNRTCERITRGILDDYGNWTGLLAKLDDRFCDFILGGYYPDNEVTVTFWTSDCYLYDSHTWYVKLAEPRPNAVALYTIFADETWICCILVLIVTWGFWYFFANMLPEPPGHKDISLAAINSMGVTICVSVNERPTCNASRTFFFMFALYGLNLTSTYTSNLISVFSNPGYLHQIDNLNEVVEAKIPFGGAVESRDWFENDEDNWIFELYNDSAEFIPNSQNLPYVQTGERVIMSSRAYILQHNISDYIYAFPYNVFSSPLQMIVKPGFPFLYEINWLLRYFRDMGFFVKIESEFRYNNTYLNRIAKMRPDFKESAIVLTTEHLQGPFALLFMGVCGSTMSFLGELFVYFVMAPFLRRRYGWNLASSVDTKKMEKANRKPNVTQMMGRRTKRRTKANRVKTEATVRAIRFTPIFQKKYKIK